MTGSTAVLTGASFGSGHSAKSSPLSLSSSLMAPLLPRDVTFTRTALSHFSTFHESARCPWWVAEGGIWYTYCGSRKEFARV